MIDDFSQQAEMELIYKIAWVLYRKLPAHVLLEDLIQSGYQGLLEARLQFKPDYKTQFSTYARWRVRGAMIDFLRLQDWTPRSVVKAKREAQKAVQQIEDIHQKQAQSKAVANALQKELNDFYQMVHQVCQSHILSLDDENTYHEVSDANLKEDARYDVDYLSYVEEILDAVLDLDEQLKTIMLMHYVLGYSQTEIAQEFGVSRARICQLNKSGIDHLKSHFLMH